MSRPGAYAETDEMPGAGGHALGVPGTDAAIEAVAAAVGLVIAAPCLPGVRANLAVLGHHAAILLDRSSGIAR